MTNALIIFYKKHNLLYIIKKGSCQVLVKEYAQYWLTA